MFGSALRQSEQVGLIVSWSMICTGNLISVFDLMLLLGANLNLKLSVVCWWSARSKLTVGSELGKYGGTTYIEELFEIKSSLVLPIGLFCRRRP
jgi:hypothetical protein